MLPRPLQACAVRGLTFHSEQADIQLDSEVHSTFPDLGAAFKRLGNEFVPIVHRCAAAIPDTTRQYIEKEKTTCDLPPTEIANTCAAPDVRGKFAITVGNILWRSPGYAQWEHRILALPVRRCIRNTVSSKLCRIFQKRMEIEDWRQGADGIPFT